ncbi:hypothetical protein GCM10007989_17230 [Devosia pacifica]|uniref:DUF1150 domain-containing protein n=1 Tax=Devosia pacifica TaxID=1335967 RepID=A0A918S647_9HYPH|nr:DUF1150 family protein [Devosia pacifica]GHA22390.1 hypothetical protein GCM10007989_17230 [Devosia pacifica]
MIEKRTAYPDLQDGTPNPLKTLTAEQFAALGGNAVAFVRPITGTDLSDMITDADFEDESIYQLVMSADGTPLLVTDTDEAVDDWLTEHKLGLVSLH